MMEEQMNQRPYEELRPANVYDVAANETWLEDMAKKGYHLTGFTGWGGVFEKGEPRECRYCMSPLPRKEKAPEAEQAALYGALGWTYVTTMQGAFHVWRCGDPAAPELDTDPVVQEESYGWLKRRMFRDGVWSCLLVAALMVISALLPMAYDTPLLDIVWDNVPGTFLARLVLGALFLAMAIIEVRSMRRLLRSLRAGVPLDRPRPYRGQKRLARVLMALLVFVLVMNILGRGRTISGGSLTQGWNVYECDGVKDGAVYVDLGELHGTDGKLVFFGARTKVHELAPRMYFIDQYETLRGGGEVTASARTEYYRLLTGGLAKQLIKELIQDRPGSFGTWPHPDLKPVAAGTLDEFWWCRAETVVQYAAVRLGREVLLVQYEGPADLREADAYFAKLLAD